MKFDSRSMCRRHSGFTLIELLVVISIIALLVSILLPALGSARKSAMNIQCQSQIRQVGMALAMYMGDNEQYFPYDRNLVDGQWQWFEETLNTYLELPTQSWTDVAEAEVWHCTVLWPEVPRDSSVPGQWGVYGSNGNYMGFLIADGYYSRAYAPYGSGKQNAKESFVETPPQETVTFMEALRPYSWLMQSYNDANYPGPRSHWLNPHFSKTSVNYGSPYNDHRELDGSANPVFLDGHAGSHRFTEFPAYGSIDGEDRQWTYTITP